MRPSPLHRSPPSGAGPEPQDGKPVGLVYVAVAGPGDPVVRELRLSGNRSAVRTESVTAVLSLFAEQLRGAPARA